MGQPTLRRKTHKKTSHISWSEYAMGGEELARYNKHMSPIMSQIHEIFQEHKAELGRNSVAAYGGAHGSWVYCPNDVADQVMSLVALYQARFTCES